MPRNWKTEEEAKKLWCPQSRAVNAKLSGEVDTEVALGSPVFNVYITPAPGDVIPKVCQCRASCCAMWVWSGTFHHIPGEGKVGVKDASTGYTKVIDAPGQDIPLGGCGLRSDVK